jgi:hypothetical protein
VHALDIQDLTKRYPRGTEALRGVSLELWQYVQRMANVALSLGLLTVVVAALFTLNDRLFLRGYKLRAEARRAGCRGRARTPCRRRLRDWSARTRTCS